MNTIRNTNSMRRSSGFTLLELLVVVTILAIVGGAMITSYDGQDTKAARGVATNAIAGIEDAMRIFTVQEGVLPDELESITCLDFDLAAHPTTVSNSATPATVTTEETTKFGGASNLPQTGGGLGKKVSDKFDLVSIPSGMGASLVNAGITTLRYAEIESCDTDDSTPAAAKGPDTVNAPMPQGSLALMNIPAMAFESPRPGSFGSRNRGRGFARGVDFGGDPTPALMVWKRGTLGYNNVKIGGADTDVIVGLGLGQASSAVGGPFAPFSKAPFYGDLAKDKYPHYIMLIKVGEDTDGDLSTTGDQSASSTATLIAVVDARGDFLDEEFAEFTGQKL